MSSNDIMTWVGNTGFAIVVATFLLVRIEGKLDQILKKLG